MYWLVSYEIPMDVAIDGEKIRLDINTLERYFYSITTLNVFNLTSRKMEAIELSKFIDLIKLNKIQNVWIDGSDLFKKDRNTGVVSSCLRSVEPLWAYCRGIQRKRMYLRHYAKYDLAVIEYTSEYLITLNYGGKVSVLSFEDVIVQLSGDDFRSADCNLSLSDIQELRDGKHKNLSEIKRATRVEVSGEHLKKVRETETINSVKDITTSGGYHIASNGVLTITGSPNIIVCRECYDIVVGVDSSFADIQLMNIEGKCKILPEFFGARMGRATTFKLPDGLQRIGSHCFTCTKMDRFDLRKYTKVREIGKRSFCENQSLKELYLPDNVTKIITSCKENSNMEVLLLPRNCRELALDVLFSSISLRKLGLPEKRFSIHEGNPYSSLENCIVSLVEIYTTKENYGLAKEIVRFCRRDVKIIVGNRV